jgi:hypothetical protein
MPAHDMLDVIHYFFEEDMNHQTSEQAEAKSKTRTKLYMELYGVTYKFAQQTTNNMSINPDDYETEDGPDMSSTHPFDPKNEPTKAYTPTSTFNPESSSPFGNALDSPMR